MRVDISASEGRLLGFYLVSPAPVKHPDGRIPTIVISPGFVPGSTGGAEKRLEELAERLSIASGWNTLAWLPSGIEGSGTSFTPMRWADDQRSVVRHVVDELSGGPVVLVNFDLLGTVTIHAALYDGDVAGAAFISLSHLAPTLEEATEALELMGASNVKIDPELSPARFMEEIEKVSPWSLPADIFSKPWLTIFSMPRGKVEEERLKRSISPDSMAEVHRFTTDPESLRYDPRAISVILGWLDRRF